MPQETSATRRQRQDYVLSITSEYLPTETIYSEEGDTIKQPNIHHVSCLIATHSHVQLNNSIDLS